MKRLLLFLFSSIMVVGAAAQMLTVKQKLVINYTPKEAMVLIDSKPYKGNGRVEAELPLGEHTYMIAATGYVTAEGMVKLNGGKERVFTEQLEKESAVTTTEETETPETEVPMQVPIPLATTTSATSNMDNGHEWVDLGLSVYWATMNVGASTPSGYGGYFAWGETTKKLEYSWSTYKWCNGNYNSMTKYCTKSDYGTVDNKTILDSSDDVAHVKWGGNWRMPTIEELRELMDKCTWTWTTQDGHNGYKVTGPNGNTIFLPAAGFRYDGSLGRAGSAGGYRSRTLNESGSYGAWFLNFNSSFFNADYTVRYYGFTVRPVWLSD